VVSATRSSPGALGYQWDLTFSPGAGNVTALRATSFNLGSSTGSYTLSAFTVREGTTPMGGFFNLISGSRNTSMLPYSVSANDLEDELRTFFNKTVEVAVEYTTKGKAWTVTFPPEMGDVSPLVVNGSSLMGANYTARVTEVQNGTAFIRGNFTFAWRSRASTPLAYNARPHQVAAAIRALGNWTAPVLVDRTDLDSDIFEWVITLPVSAGNVGAFRVISQLTGTNASIRSWTAVNGTYVPRKGTFSLGFLGNYTRDLSYNATARQVQVALQRDTQAGNVSVTRRSYLEDGYAGYLWNVSFTSFGTPSWPGEVGLIGVDTANLTGENSLTTNRPLQKCHI
jgi:hypothetical protein